MRRSFNAKITYKVKPTHPDIQDLPEKYWKDKKFTYEDVYHINDEHFFGEDHIIDSIKEDLMVTAGGGYNADHITDVEFEIEEV